MNQKSINIHELIMTVCSELEKFGYQQYYVWGHYFVAMNTIEKFHNSRNCQNYNSELTSEFVTLVHKRYENGEISGCRRSIAVKAAKYLDEYFAYGHISWERAIFTKRPALSPEFQKHLDAFMTSRTFNSTSGRDFNWAIRKHLMFLQDNGHSAMKSVSISDIKAFVAQIATTMSSSSLRDIQCYIRQFYSFLQGQNVEVPDCFNLLSYRVPLQHKVKDYITNDELDKILAQIDTSTLLGKRNMAIILLAASTGLRSADIVKLKLSSIDWEQGKIYLVQSKTNGDVHLPLTADAGNAIKSYILSGRQASNHSEIFLSSVAPYMPMASVSVRTMFDKYLRKAGISRSPFDGKTFHGLRRRMGHNLLSTGCSINTIAQILGHQNTASTEKYLSLDYDRLKLCALDFKHINVMGGAF